eukprot:2162349-Pleurochrysis_carterae.AAC.2
MCAWIVGISRSAALRVKSTQHYPFRYELPQNVVATGLAHQAKWPNAKHMSTVPFLLIKGMTGQPSGHYPRAE